MSLSRVNKLVSIFGAKFWSEATTTNANLKVQGIMYQVIAWCATEYDILGLVGNSVLLNLVEKVEGYSNEHQKL